MVPGLEFEEEKIALEDSTVHQRQQKRKRNWRLCATVDEFRTGGIELACVPRGGYKFGRTDSDMMGAVLSTGRGNLTIEKTGSPPCGWGAAFEN